MVRRLPKQAHQAKTADRRSRGRDRSTRKESVMEAMGERGVTWRSALASAADQIAKSLPTPTPSGERKGVRERRRRRSLLIANGNMESQ